MIQDPEAADRVLRSSADVTMVGLDVTHRCLLGSTDVTPWNAAHTEASRFLTAIAEFSIRANAASDPIFAAGMPLHDPLAAAVVLDSTFVGTLDLPMCVETRTDDGTGVRGRTIGNPQDSSMLPYAPRMWPWASPANDSSRGSRATSRICWHRVADTRHSPRVYHVHGSFA